jgi:hypothetical protein
MLGLGSGINRLSAAEPAAIAGRIPGFTGLLDESYGSGAAAAYSVRKLTNSVSVAMTIRRDSDSTETDIGFDSNGNLDEGAITAFCTGTTCRVASWKDQSGNDNHAAQAVASNQPTIYTGGAIVKVDGKPALQGTSTSKLPLSSTLTLSGEASHFTLCTTRGTDNPWGGDGSGSEQMTWIYFPNTNTNWRLINSTQIANYAVPFTPSDTRVLQNHNRNSSNSTPLYLDGVSVATKTFLGNITVKAIMGSNWFNYDGIGQEFIFYDTDKNANEADISNNIGDYFTQNTPLLDTYTGAAAAYSLRKLSSSYSGPAIRVRRDNDNLETDINFNIFGGLDTVSLAAHCGSNNGYVTNWYDQSSNSNDATQTTAGNQPKIYDGTTGVVTENGKPALSFDGSNDKFQIGSSISATSNYAFAWVQKRTTASGWLFDTETGRLVVSNGSNGLYYDGAWKGTAQTSTTHNVNFLSLVSPSSGNYYENGTNTQSGLSYSQTAMSGPTAIGGHKSVTSNQIDGTLQEFIIYNSDQSKDRTNIEDNINTFYSIY